MFVALRTTNAPLFFPFYALLPSKGMLIDLINFAAYYGGYVQLGTSFFVSLNRLTAATAPTRHIRVITKTGKKQNGSLRFRFGAGCSR